MCSVDSGLWCWDATTQAAIDHAPSQRRGWRGVLSFSFEVGVRQGRVTLPCKSLRGVRAPNSSIFMCVDWSAGDEVPYLSSALGVADVSLELLLLTDTFCGKYPTLGTPPFRANF